MFAPDAERLWSEYLSAEEANYRDEALRALNRFITARLATPEADWKLWAKQTAAQLVERNLADTIRSPLYARLLLPALAEGVLRREPNCARLLSHFDQHLLTPITSYALPEDLRTSVGLLYEALRIDPQDDAARRSYLSKRARYFDHTLHELPAGVLYAMDGANVEQCDELIAMLAEFVEHANIAGQTDYYRVLIDDCRKHYSAYREYLVAGRPDESYDAYLEAHGL